MPATVRSEMKTGSNSARAAKLLRTSLPEAVVVSTWTKPGDHSYGCGVYEQLASSSLAIECRWRASAEMDDTHRVSASEHWDIMFTRRQDGSYSAELGGPTLRARVLDSWAGEQYWGVQLAAHVAIADIDKATLLGATVALPIDGDTVTIAGSTLRRPAWDGLEEFVDRLVAAGSLISDDPIRRALNGDGVGYSQRSWKRRFRRVTGITRKQAQQLARARHAYLLLQRGLTPTQTAAAAGFADQPHLTRALRLLQGQTPAAILASAPSVLV